MHPSHPPRDATAPTIHPARRRAVIALAGALATATARARTGPPIEGQALALQDGDSFVLATDDGRRLPIRVAGIDAPERQQPFGEAAHHRLGELLRDHRLRVEPVKQDLYGRTVATVFVVDGAVPGLDAGLALVEAGLAWHFVRYGADQSTEAFARYARAERRARARRVGLWREPAPEAPWEFRARARRADAAQPRGHASRRAD